MSAIFAFLESCMHAALLYYTPHSHTVVFGNLGFNILPKDTLKCGMRLNVDMAYSLNNDINHAYVHKLVITLKV